MISQGTQEARDEEVVINEQMLDKPADPSEEGRIQEPTPAPNDIKPNVISTTPFRPRRNFGAPSSVL
jgi:hypothetical protein